MISAIVSASAAVNGRRTVLSPVSTGLAEKPAARGSRVIPGLSEGAAARGNRITGAPPRTVACVWGGARVTEGGHCLRPRLRGREATQAWMVSAYQ